MVKVNIIGFKELAERIKRVPQSLQKEIGAEIQFSGERFAELARKDVAKDTGQLAGSIRPKRINETAVEVTAGKLYAPYVEWGTITKVQVPSELQAYAIQFKGKGIRKTGGMLPRPFFFKQIPIVRKETIDHIENILKDII